MNSSAHFHTATKGIIPITSILDLNIYAASTNPTLTLSNSLAFSQISADASVSTSSTTISAIECCDLTTHDHAPHHHDHPITTQTQSHSNDITSISIPLPILPFPLLDSPFETLLSSLLWEGQLPNHLSEDCSASSTNPNQDIERSKFDILRTKGFIITEDGRNWILQGVREDFKFVEVHASSASRLEGEEETENGVKPKLVLIGRGLRGDLRDKLIGLVIELGVEQ